MLIIEVFFSIEVLIKNQLICVSVAVKAYILTDFSRDVLGGDAFHSSKNTTSVVLPYSGSELGKQLIISGCQVYVAFLSSPVKAI